MRMWYNFYTTFNSAEPAGKMIVGAGIPEHPVVLI